ncbi:hypothetical protein G7085_05365 [Tessaracoccus sp. HDW20]|uniref:hypothetical protein n=1 Tax=Tessaracoccus coleopterorum TaxID=2714950 RepID=UPI0018D4C7F6|nr:hypothetical protein [Tessaracoccus coleopterorum]NHB84244.1 hypothetical protein [Tessaracoccus coleopterorum]
MVTDAYRLTYSSLRWLLALLPGVLFIVTVGTAIVQGHLEGSISAYYGGPVRDIFVGVLVAEAALLVAYQGSTALEDYNFNGAGFYAVLVALIPTGLVDNIQALKAGLELSPGGTSPSDLVWSLRFSLTLFGVIAVALVVREVRSTTRVQKLLAADKVTVTFVTVTFATLIALQALVLWQVWVPAPEDVTMDGLRSVPLLRDIPFLGRLRIHDMAAIFFIAALAVGVWCHGWPRKAAVNGRERVAPAALVWVKAYQVIFVAMVAGPLVAWVVSALFAPGRFVILLEWWEIALFTTFWVTETVRQERLPASRPPEIV